MLAFDPPHENGRVTVEARMELKNHGRGSDVRHREVRWRLGQDGWNPGLNGCRDRGPASNYGTRRDLENIRRQRLQTRDINAADLGFHGFGEFRRDVGLFPVFDDIICESSEDLVNRLMELTTEKRSFFDNYGSRTNDDSLNS